MGNLIAHFRPAAILLAVGLLFVSVTAGQSDADKQAAKMKARIQKLGTGPSARIKVGLRNGSTVSGYVSEIRDNTFVLISDQSGSATEIAYSDARKPPKRISNAMVGVIAISAAVGVLLLWAARHISQ